MIPFTAFQETVAFPLVFDLTKSLDVFAGAFTAFAFDFGFGVGFAVGFGVTFVVDEGFAVGFVTVPGDGFVGLIVGSAGFPSIIKLL